MQHYLVELYLNNNKVYEKIVTASRKENAISNIMRNKDEFIEFNKIKVYKVKVTYSVMEEFHGKY